MVGRFLAGMVDPFGFGGKLGGVGGTLASLAPDSFTDAVIGKGRLPDTEGMNLIERYRAIRDKAEGGLSNIQEQNPLAYGAGNLASVGGLAAKPAQVLFKNAKSLWDLTKAGSKLGAGEGALAGAGHSEADNLQDFAGDVAGTSAVGTLLGGALSPAVSMAGSVSKFIGSKVKATNPDVVKERAGKMLRGWLDRSKKTTDDVTASLGDDLTLPADFNPELQSVMKSLAGQGGETAEAVLAPLAQRANTRVNRFDELFSESFDGVSPSEARELTAGIKSQASELYEQAMGSRLSRVSRKKVADIYENLPSQAKGKVERAFSDQAAA